MSNTEFVKTEAIEVPLTARLQREAARWAGSRRPVNIEETRPGQRSVWDFPRPPAVERVLETVTIEFAGKLVVSTETCVRVCETASPPTYYVPRGDVLAGSLREASGASMCEWKGRAAYLDLVVDGKTSAQAAWWYPSVLSEYACLREHIAFYASRVDRCTIGGETVTPQPGQFYAGWITSELAGPWKGGPGSQGW